MPIHEKNLIEEDRILEKEKAELEGRDVSGQWNTFIEQRILSQYEPEIFQEIYSRPEGRTINRCWQCGTCTSGCCMHTDFGLREFNPRYFIYLARIGDEEELKKQKDVIWRCLACNKCVERSCAAKISRHRALPVCLMRVSPFCISLQERRGR